MGADEGKYGHLRLIQGGKGREIIVGGVSVVVAPRTEPPFAVDALVFEEDTFLVMSASPEVAEPPIHPVHLLTELFDARPEAPGRVLRREGYPLRFLAVVYDFSSNPPSRDSWVAQALDEALAQAERAGVSSLALPLLGLRRDEAQRNGFLGMLVRALRKAAPRQLRQIWFMVASEHRVDVVRRLRALTSIDVQGRR